MYSFSNLVVALPPIIRLQISGKPLIRGLIIKIYSKIRRMTLKELKVLSKLLIKFSSDYYSYNPPFELNEVVNMVIEAIEAEKSTKINR
jgi:hypothetical protein